MSHDDWYDRIRDSNAYLDRTYDQHVFEQTQAETRDAVYDGILSGDHAKARRALGIPMEDETSPDERFREHRDRLIRTVGSSPFLHRMFTVRWIFSLSTIDLDDPSARDVLYDFAAEYDRFYQDSRPHPGGMRFEEEMRWIVRDVRAVWAMLS